MHFRAFVVKAPLLTIPLYGGKILLSSAAAKILKVISQNNTMDFYFLNDGNLDQCLGEKKIRHTLVVKPALSQMYDQLYRASTSRGTRTR